MNAYTKKGVNKTQNGQTRLHVYTNREIFVSAFRELNGNQLP